MGSQQVLACFLDGTGSTEAQVRGRLLQGRKMFNKLRPFLCCRRFRKQNALVDFTPRSGPACCGVLAAGLRR